MIWSRSFRKCSKLAGFTCLLYGLQKLETKMTLMKNNWNEASDDTDLTGAFAGLKFVVTSYRECKQTRLSINIHSLTYSEQLVLL